MSEIARPLNVSLNLWGTTKPFLKLLCPKPFPWSKNERRLAEENLRIKNTTESNLVDAESH